MNNSLSKTNCICCNSTDIEIYDKPIEYFHCQVCEHKWKLYNCTDYNIQKNRNSISRFEETDNKIKERYDFLKNYVLFNNVLEIGCADGIFLKYISDLNPDARCIGVEPSLDGRERIKNVTIENLDFNSFSTSEKFDTILAFHVIEHVLNPRIFIEKIKSILSNNGSLVIEAPYKTGNRNVMIDPNTEHIHQFTVSSFMIIAERLGFKIDKFQGDVFESSIYNDCFRIILKRDNRINDVESYILNINAKISDPIIIYGLGEDFHGYIENYIDWNNVVYCIDNNLEKQKNKIRGLDIKDPRSAIENEYNILICSYYYGLEIANYLISIGINKSRIIHFEDIINKE